MSLINEALKKAQSDRPSSVHEHPALQGMPMDTHQKPPKKKRYLFGFIMAILVVALLSTLVSTYLVYQILGSDAEPAESTPPQEAVAVAQQESASTDIEKPSGTASVQPTEAAPPAQEESVALIQDEQPLSAEAPPVQEPVATQQPEPAATIPEPVASVAQPVPVAEEPAPEVAAIGTNPQIWNRLQELEIRGIMSGGTKVLIFDNRTNKARAYIPGDLVDGALSLRLSSISQNIINFENNDGLIFPKSF